MKYDGNLNSVRAYASEKIRKSVRKNTYDDQKLEHIAMNLLFCTGKESGKRKMPLHRRCRKG